MEWYHTASERRDIRNKKKHKEQRQKNVNRQEKDWNLCGKEKLGG